MSFTWNLFLTPDRGPRNPLAFAMELQKQTEWCWSANAVSVNRYFNVGNPWQQCRVVNLALKQTTCCEDGSTANCNQPWFLNRALEIVKNFDQMQYRRGTLNEIETAIDDGRPLCVRIQWATGGGHFVTIFGYAGNTINIADPLYGYTAMDYSSFPQQYYDGGEWTHTYWVRS